ncbi:iron-containing alcohol dehydrogenase [Amedibacillus sp. YH-ame10]
MSFKMHIPTNLLFGEGTLSQLHEQKMPGKHALILITNGKSTRVNGYLDRLMMELDKAEVTYDIFDKIQANPLKSTVMEGAAFAREHRSEFVVALGGGSVMDAGKAICAMATNEGDLWDYIGNGTGKGMPLQHDPLPLIAISTTAGTGSEIDMGAVITNEETYEKAGFIHPLNFPVLSIVDPSLMCSVPPKFTAFQGFDALFHSLEGYISNKANLLSDMYALTAIEKVAKYLPAAVHEGKNMEARENIAFANTLSGIVMVVGSTTSEHSLEHALSAYHQELPHGAGLLMISKAYFTHFIQQHVCDERFIKMAQAMGKSDASDPMDFIEVLDQLQKACYVDDLKMSDYGIKREEFDTFVKNAKSAMSRLFANDRVALSDEDCKAIYEASYK